MKQKVSHKSQYCSVRKELNHRKTRGLFSLFLVGCLLLINVHGVIAEDGSDPSKLEGRWQRTDGGYILELSTPKFDGQLTARYFNPNPINVGRSMWRYKEGYLGVFVELRAPNYPGSTYSLLYDSASDRLAGIYFQATMKQQYEVEFMRVQ